MQLRPERRRHDVCRGEGPVFRLVHTVVDQQMASEHFGSAEAFEQFLDQGPLPQQPLCLLLDVRMPGPSGLVLFSGYSGSGAQPPGCVWPTVFATATPGVVFFVEMHASCP